MGSYTSGFLILHVRPGMTSAPWVLLECKLLENYDVMILPKELVYESRAGDEMCCFGMYLRMMFVLQLALMNVFSNVIWLFAESKDENSTSLCR